MYIYVNVQFPETYYANGPDGLVKARLEQASGERCLVVPYREFDRSVVEQFQPRAIAMSGFGGHFEDHQIKWFWGMNEVLHTCDLPMICFCGSHQLLGFAFNQDLTQIERLEDEPIRRMEPGEDLPRRPRQSPEVDLSDFYVAEGFFPIRRVQDDPLFEGLPETMIMRCWHYCEVKTLPPGFDLLASSGHSRIAAMRHADRPLYGTQFHPEAYAEPFFHGRTMLKNFSRIVKEFWK